jgi:hypothetical protein
VFYVALVNIGLDDKELRRINKFVLMLFLIQIPAIIYKFSIFGVDERTIGIYATRWWWSNNHDPHCNGIVLNGLLLLF